MGFGELIIIGSGAGPDRRGEADSVTFWPTWLRSGEGGREVLGVVPDGRPE
jgi:hypothetical protein